MEDFTAGEVRARTFRVAMRGFDQGEVDGYLEQLAGYLDAVQQQLHEIGITELSPAHDLAAEYGAVGAEVARVLEEARSVADAMRFRATSDTARWRADAAAESEQLRRAAWEAGTEMLDQVIAESESLIANAREVAHQLRAGAERDSARLLTDAKREQEELTRAGRDEAERTVIAARKEADSVLMASRHQAEVAQERAKALEDRRAELMDELEAAQKAVLGIEDQTVQDRAEGQGDEGPEPASPGRSRWPDDEGGVRIVAAPANVPPEAVDADALAAEVEAMRVGSVVPHLGGDPASAPSKTGGGATKPPPLDATGVASSPTVEETEQSESERAAKLEPEPRPASEVAAEPESEPVQEADPVPEPESEPESGPDPLAGLFDELRAPRDTVAESPNGQAEQRHAATVTVLAEEPSQTLEATRDSRLATRDSDPFALRDRLLLPVQNRALRLIKRRLVSAQNQALEELRLDADWSPGPSLLNGEIAGVLVELVEESVAAGVGAAAELLGSAEAATPTVEIEDPSVEFTGAFIEAVTQTLERSRGAGAGKRETSSSLSRVFRAWRTDDAERRVRLRSRAAYHLGLLASLQAMGCGTVVVALFDRSCRDHGDASGPWAIAEGPPAGVLIPPASLECSCTVVPDDC